MKLFSRNLSVCCYNLNKKGFVMNTTKSGIFILAAVMTVLFTSNPASAQCDFQAQSKLMKVAEFSKVHKKATNNTATCDELQAMKAKMPMENCKWVDFPVFVQAEAQKCAPPAPLSCDKSLLKKGPLSPIGVYADKVDEAKSSCQDSDLQNLLQLEQAVNADLAMASCGWNDIQPKKYRTLSDLGCSSATVAKAKVKPTPVVTTPSPKINCDVPFVKKGHKAEASVKAMLRCSNEEVAFSDEDLIDIGVAKADTKTKVGHYAKGTSKKVRDNVVRTADVGVESIKPAVIRAKETFGNNAKNLEQLGKNLNRLLVVPVSMDGENIVLALNDGSTVTGKAKNVTPDGTVDVNNTTYAKGDYEKWVEGSDFIASASVGGRLLDPANDSWFSNVQFTLFTRAGWHKGSNTSHESGMDYDVDAMGNSQEFGVEARHHTRLSENVVLVVAPSVSVHRIETMFRHQEANTGAFKTSIYVVPSIGATIGVNLYDTISVYGGGDILFGLGYKGKLGVGWTTPWPLRVAVEVDYSVLSNQSDSAYYTAEPADLHGLGVSLKLSYTF